MKLIFITAGAAGMYCGSCFRDNALAAELSRRGHDVLLVPLYTPTRTDEANVSQNRVFLGGVSVYLQQHFSLFQSTPWLLDRLWDSTPVLKLASRGSIAVEPAALGDLTISVLRGTHGRQRKEIDKLVHWLTREQRPDLVVLPNSMLIGLAEPIRRALDCPVCCTLQGEDLFLDGLSPAHRTEAVDLIRAASEHVDAFLAVSEYYVDHMSRFLGIASEKVKLVPLGINLDGYEPRAESPSGSRPTVGFFARIAPEKGLHVLCEAYQRLRTSGGLAHGRLEAAGYLPPEHRPYLASITEQMQAWGLGEEFSYRGSPDRDAKIEFLQGLDVLSVPSPYDEPKGLFLLEAMACGVPVVQPRRGAYPEMITKTGGGILVEPDDVDRLAGALGEILSNAEEARAMGERGIRGVREHYSVEAMADRALEVMQSVSRGTVTRAVSTTGA